MKTNMTPIGAAVVGVSLAIGLPLIIGMYFEEKRDDKRAAIFSCRDKVAESSSYMNIEWKGLGVNPTVTDYKDGTYDVKMMFRADKPLAKTVTVKAYCGVTKTDSGMVSMLPVMSES